MAEFQAAGSVCEIRWPFLASVHTPQRFEAFQKLGVELVVARSGDRMDGVCFVLPCRFTLNGDVIEWASLFQLATRPETRNIGGLMMMRIMHLYPTAVAMGVTDEATKMYVALRWKRYDHVWRGVHPIDMKRFAADYGERFPAEWQRRSLRVIAGAYNVMAGLGEMLLSLGVRCHKWDEDAAPALREKGATIASYFPMFRCGCSTGVVDAGGTGRVLNSFGGGWGGLREHARAWRELRARGAKLCEVLASSPEARTRLVRLGYVPVPMPMWYVEKNGMGGKLIAALRQNEVSFFHTDKSI